MAADTVSLLEYLRARFGRTALVAGFSLGGTIGALATARRPDLVATLITVGMDIDGPAAEISAYDFALTTAHERGHQRAVRQLEEIGPPPHLRSDQFATRVRWASDFGGVNLSASYAAMVRGLLAGLLGSRDYTIADVVRTVRGIAPAQEALLPELARMDLASMLTRIEVPVVMLQGRHDQVAPIAAAQRYADMLKAPNKQLIWFENSAHMPHLEEPAIFAKLLAQVRARQTLTH
jgi:pimeloyl-ACP methyl ester carboxylesterase